MSDEKTHAPPIPEGFEPIGMPSKEELRNAVELLATMTVASDGPISEVLTKVDMLCPHCEDVHAQPVAVIVAVGEPSVFAMGKAVGIAKAILQGMGVPLNEHPTEHFFPSGEDDDSQPVPEGKAGKA